MKTKRLPNNATSLTIEVYDGLTLAASAVVLNQYAGHIEARLTGQDDDAGRREAACLDSLCQDAEAERDEAIAERDEALAEVARLKALVAGGGLVDVHPLPAGSEPNQPGHYLAVVASYHGSLGIQLVEWRVDDRSGEFAPVGPVGERPIYTHRVALAE